MSPEEFRRATGVSRETLARFGTYEALLRKWQARINLVGARTLGEVWRRHFLDSAQLYVLLPAPEPKRRLAVYDLGSGAGFPGLVLALMADGAGLALSMHLVESDHRKAAFLIEAVRVLGLGDSTRVHAERAEVLAQHCPEPADAVTARALQPLEQLLELAARFLKPTGCCLFLKGARVDDELTRVRKTWKMRAERIMSRSEPAGVILRLQDIARV